MGVMFRFAAVLLAMTGVASAEPFQEVTVGIPVTNLAEAEAWYSKLLGPDVEVMRPDPGITELKIAPGVWLQLFEPGGVEDSGSILRFQVDNMAAAQAKLNSVDIDSGEAIEVPGLVTFSEFRDPDGNALGLYDLP
ncbi:MAG: VOC family protein [Rhodobacter sp.]|nr:VOC family protein [Rhodobacter sp.]